MKVFKTTILSIVTLCFVSSFSQCSSAQKLEDKDALSFEDVYYQSWTSGIQEQGSGVKLFIQLTDKTDKTIHFDSAYFRGKVVKLKEGFQNPRLYVARFKNESEYSEDIILSSEKSEEHKNKVPKIPQKLPFELKRNECVISYKTDGVTKYYKISNIREKPMSGVPMSPRNN
jgi:hypothetical protein